MGERKLHGKRLWLLRGLFNKRPEFSVKYISVSHLDSIA